MSEVLFYHLTATPLERNLPDLLQRTLQRGWRAVVRAGSAEGLRRVDDMLWTYDPASFLPHGTEQGAEQPVYLTLGDDNPGQAGVLMLIDGARVKPDEVARYDRVCLLFDGNVPDALQAARADWRAVKEAGLSGKYWAQENGRWVQKASTGE